MGHFRMGVNASQVWHAVDTMSFKRDPSSTANSTELTCLPWAFSKWRTTASIAMAAEMLAARGWFRMLEKNVFQSIRWRFSNGGWFRRPSPLAKYLVNEDKCSTFRQRLPNVCKTLQASDCSA